MTTEEKINFKTRLKLFCIKIIEQRVSNAGLAMQAAQTAANSEEKSSAGDKYETSRAMSHLEKDMHAKQLAANNKELAVLLSIDCNKINSSINTGSLVICETAIFFIAAGLGKLLFEEQTIYIISPIAPIAALLIGKVAGGNIQFNNKNLLIKECY